jgi:hypothetical protein
VAECARGANLRGCIKTIKLLDAKIFILTFLESYNLSVTNTSASGVDSEEFYMLSR